MLGNRSEALRRLGQLKRLTKKHQTQLLWENWVHIHIGLRENEKALEILEKAYQEGLKVKRYLDTAYADPLRSDPRFTELGAASPGPAMKGRQHNFHPLDPLREHRNLSCHLDLSRRVTVAES